MIVNELMPGQEEDLERALRLILRLFADGRLVYRERVFVVSDEQTHRAHRMLAWTGYRWREWRKMHERTAG